MKKWALHFLISLSVIFIPGAAHGFYPLIPGARSAGLSYATAALPGAEPVFGNPAAAAFAKRFILIINYDSRFLLRELSRTGAGAVIPFKPGAFGISLSQTGKTLFNERKVTLSYSTFLGRDFAAGIGFDLISQRIPENHTPAVMLTFEGGAILALSPVLNTAVHLINPVGVKLKTAWGEEKKWSSFRWGATWSPVEEVMICIETEKNNQSPLQLKTGVEISISGTLFIRTGVASNPMTFSIGTGFIKGEIAFDLAFTWHGNLGFTPSSGIAWKF